MNSIKINRTKTTFVKMQRTLKKWKVIEEYIEDDLTQQVYIQPSMTSKLPRIFSE